MFGNAKKTVSVAYRDKLLAEIAHYEKRIEDAINKRRPNYFEDESFEDVKNPYKFKIQPSHYELKQQEASLSNRVCMTLELAMLTIMQSEVNIMVTPPEVRKPVHEDGVWQEVAAECKIDLVSFTITFYAHKPHRKFAPTSYRNVAVTLVKPAHQKELEQSILPKLQLPNLALQVLQSYATAFRSRRTTLRELAERYAEKLKMEAMPEGGYRVRFLDLLQVDWTLKNLWSPIVPFCHRMKFEVEYMPKDYVSAIGKLYNQFKDPSLETSDRTSVLAKIFDTCLQAAGPARQMHESFESDPDTAGRLHERRTTIDQEPEVPNVEHSPKRPSGKENKAQNRKTDMAPPKTIPKKAKKSKSNQDTSESRRTVKRPIESDNSNAKRARSESDVDNSKIKAGLKGGSGTEANGDGSVSLKDLQKKDKQLDNKENEGDMDNVKISGKVTAKTAKETEKVTVASEINAKKGDNNAVKSKTKRNAEATSNTGENIKLTKKNKDEGNSKPNSEVSSKVSKKGDERNSERNIKSKDANTENNAVKSKKRIDNTANIQKANSNKDIDTVKQNENNINEKDVVRKENNTNDKPAKNIVKSKHKNKENNTESANNVEITTNTKKDTKKVTSSGKDDAIMKTSKHVTKNVDDAREVTSKEKDAGVSKTRNTYTKDNNTEEKLTKKKSVYSETVSSRPVISKDDDKDKPASKKVKDIEVDRASKKVPKNAEKDKNKEQSVKTQSIKTSTDVVKKLKDNTTQQKEESKSEINKNKGTNAKNIKETAKVSEKNKVVKEKQTESAKINSKVDENLKTQQVKTRTVNPQSVKQTHAKDDVKISSDKTFTRVVRNEEKTDRNDEILAKKKKTTETNSNDEILAKKRKITEANSKATKNNVNQPKKPTDNTESLKNDPKTNTTRILKEKTNRNGTLQKPVEKNEITQNTNKKNMLNVTITKSKIIPLSKLPAEKQIKMANKLKTKIPMMKNKMTFSSLSNRVNNVGAISKGVDKTNIPQKSLPVFRKLANNLPTRFSPRKLPIFKPSSQGFSNK